MSWRRLIMASMSDIDLLAIETNLRQVSNRIRLAYDSSPTENRSSTPIRLVAVSKTKPTSAILAAYRYGQRHFGENYVQELIAKANDPELISECQDIRWHFIGHLQTNKITKLIQSVSNLYLIETIDSEKCARKLNDVFKEKIGDSTTTTDDKKILRVMIEVNTSGESQKSGVGRDEAVELASFIKESCPYLRFMGFMTIGALEPTDDRGNADFQRLIETRSAFCRKHSIQDEKSIELSMGMSGDFENAIRMGSTNVRIGSTIFGVRPNISDQK